MEPSEVGEHRRIRRDLVARAREKGMGDTEIIRRLTMNTSYTAVRVIAHQYIEFFPDLGGVGEFIKIARRR